ncbi:MAG: beta-ketoacyl-ACP synthase I [Maricaulis sp.]|jgi:3-oxoacyl-[acyl-carrier-protein] synthase-1|uniref:beta-ketoacyl-ACP synthase I n=1 Tax=Maricaulis sp. TaxID=1486257 RepID=UPI001B2AFC9C|nr:beta-ketoacyl-ACP synthase I [Maricaulis sp.]MBO6728625.1 beta-ketoacyl-ACP synthase I [Maricaulis sp.]MBO6846150.1 beta-ketoacyl-ACP synthase I [Maricaulis sp.]MBO6875973.1 beta-ketoacyl-ACP synthase I [Maricaulis sp.]MDM7985008.1 beta-ketoacyl-ACP synthase I [Maricaulis sp.]
MRRVVITGLGVISPIGNNAAEVTQSLKDGKSGIGRMESFAEHGFKCQVGGKPSIDPAEHVDKRVYRFMSEGAGWNYMAMEQAIEDAGLPEGDISHERTGIIMGSGGPSAGTIVSAADVTRDKGPRRIGPFAVPKAMSSTASATLATPFKILGVNYSITSACTTSLHCIGAAAEQIQWGKQDVMFAGGCEEIHWALSNLFDAMGAMSTKYNDTPTEASRAFDKDRDGFVGGAGAGVVILEEYERAKKRGAPIYAEITGYGATSDGYDMVAPSGEGAVRSMKLAMETVSGPIDYLNPHATATPVGDIKEMEAVKEVFGDNAPMISGTKSMTGHSLGAAGVHEAIYTLLMMKNGFVAPSINVFDMDPDIAALNLPIVTEARDADLKTTMSNSFGFGGTNGTVVFQKV